jgi:hypothetical protein
MDEKQHNPRTIMNTRFLFSLPTIFRTLLLLAAFSIESLTLNGQTKLKGKHLDPKPAIEAILAAFNRYEVVGMSEAHRNKDEDDFILTLIRTPAFMNKVNDIVVECGNSLYQPILDRYIAGEDIPVAEVEKVWRNTTQPMCNTSGFFQEFFPLVRAINRQLPPERRLRVLAGDPPIDWDQIKSEKDVGTYDGAYDRNQNIASVMEKEVLSKHRKALMLFGINHLMHESADGGPQDRNAVQIYEKDYPNRTFVIRDLEGLEDVDSPSMLSSPFANWQIPSLVLLKGTWLGALPLARFLSSRRAIKLDNNCTASIFYPDGPNKPTEKFVDALLYLGPPSLAMRELVPASIASDSDLMADINRRAKLVGGFWIDYADAGGSEVRLADKVLLHGLKPPKPANLKSAEAICRQARQQTSISFKGKGR